ncbi:thermonuclease family protein [Bradyrhizobium sp. LHD-71]|uniref:thermonuclease family protein n=1 Tax=Bradyrhizobium sp. LHD-71 TaxID=3072141 RepID=UPI00280F988F|nr:thermonuclease family protein [Bradyrhizobium sp. LHD-71]MDQ8729691.1 thermonuclease family protein [Bradyrhizobium sp. LHD-71]
MFLTRGLNTPHIGRSWHRRLTAVLPWVFVLCVAAGSTLPLGEWSARLGVPWKSSEELQRERDSETIWRRAGNPSVRHEVDVLRTVDGDTFDARVVLWPGLELDTRVRLRGIDAPEIHASCEVEFRKAQVSTRALRTMLAEGGVAIFNIGPDKYGGRVVADVATRNTPNVSSALVAAGHVRAYLGGRRQAWCNGPLR